MLQLPEKLRDELANCIVTAIHPHMDYIIVNRLVSKLTQLKPEKEGKCKKTTKPGG